MKNKIASGIIFVLLITLCFGTTTFAGEKRMNKMANAILDEYGDTNWINRYTTMQAAALADEFVTDMNRYNRKHPRSGIRVKSPRIKSIKGVYMTVKHKYWYDKLYFTYKGYRCELPEYRSYDYIIKIEFENVGTGETHDAQYLMFTGYRGGKHIVTGPYHKSKLLYSTKDGDLNVPFSHVYTMEPYDIDYSEKKLKKMFVQAIKHYQDYTTNKPNWSKYWL